MIEVDSVVRSFGRRKRRTVPLADVSHSFADGELTYLIGLNGTGKSTLLRCLGGVLAPDSGTVLVDGLDLPRTPAPARHLGLFLDPDSFHTGHTGRRHLQWLAACAGAPDSVVGTLLRHSGLAGVADRPIAGYSLGMRQRLGIASVLVGNPRNIVLDEPMNGLDVSGALWLRGLLREWADESRCVVVASHGLGEIARTADRVLILDNGGIVARGTVDEVCGRHGSLEEAFLAHVPRATAGAQVGVAQ